MKYIAQDSKNRILNNILVKRKEPANKCEQDIFPFEVLINDFVFFIGNNQKEGRSY